MNNQVLPGITYFTHFGGVSNEVAPETHHSHWQSMLPSYTRGLKRSGFWVFPPSFGGKSAENGGSDRNSWGFHCEIRRKLYKSLAGATASEELSSLFHCFMKCPDKTTTCSLEYVEWSEDMHSLVDKIVNIGCDKDLQGKLFQKSRPQSLSMSQLTNCYWLNKKRSYMIHTLWKLPDMHHDNPQYPNCSTDMNDNI